MFNEYPKININKPTKNLVDFVITYGVEKRLPNILYLINLLKPFGGVHVLLLSDHDSVLARQTCCDLHYVIHLGHNLSDIYNYGLRVTKKQYVVFVSDDERPSKEFLENLYDICETLTKEGAGIGKVRYAQILDGFVYGKNAKFYAEKIICKAHIQDKGFTGTKHITFDPSIKRIYFDYLYYHLKTINDLLYSHFWSAGHDLMSDKMTLPEYLKLAKEGNDEIYNCLLKHKNDNYSTNLAYLYYVCVLHTKIASEQDFIEYFNFMLGEYSVLIKEQVEGEL